MKIFKAHEKIDDIVMRNRNIIFTVVQREDSPTW